MWAKIFEKSGNYLMLYLKSTTWFWASGASNSYTKIFKLKTATFFDSMAHSGAGG